MSVKAVLLGAGKGTRMKSDLAKVLYRAAGRPLVNWMLEIVAQAGVAETVVVVGHQADDVAAVLPPGTRTAHQPQQLGTGHAARVGLEALQVAAGDIVLVLPGDMPLVRPETLEHLVELHRGTGAVATLLSCQPADPTGYGRVLRGATGHVLGIVEQRDATAAQLAIREVGTSVYAFDAMRLGQALAALSNHNQQGEYYLTDVIGELAGAGHRVEAMVAAAIEGEGVNSHDQLATAAAELRRRINRGWMRAGVWMEDPERTYVDADVLLEPGVRLRADTHLEGATTVAAGAEVGPSTYVTDSRIGPGAHVWYSVLRQADVGADAEVGPYVSLRPGAMLLDRSKAGTFVEIKNSVVGEDSKVPHLSYVGDAEIGKGSNIGAGTITVNYDGYQKHRTVIGDGAKIGSDTMLVAPVTIGDEAWTAAGSVITKDIAAGALAVARSPQREVPGYAARRRARADREKT